MHPACCAACGTGTCDLGFMDLAIYYDYEGQVYLCMTCVEELTESAGLLNSTEIRYLEALTKDATAEAERLRSENEALSERLNHYDSLFDVKFDSHPDLSVAEQQRRTEVREPSAELTDEVGDNESVVTESGEVEGTTESVRSESSNGSLEL
jgi:hypothetical protein